MVSSRRPAKWRWPPVVPFPSSSAWIQANASRRRPHHVSLSPTASRDRARARKSELLLLLRPSPPSSRCHDPAPVRSNWRRGIKAHRRDRISLRRLHYHQCRSARRAGPTSIRGLWRWRGAPAQRKERGASGRCRFAVGIVDSRPGKRRGAPSGAEGERSANMGEASKRGGCPVADPPPAREGRP